MSSASAEPLSQAVHPRSPGAADPPPPEWVLARLGEGTRSRGGWTSGRGTRLGVTESSDHALITAVVPGARDAGCARLHELTRDAYEQIACAVGEVEAAHPVRFWNHVPAITHDCGHAEGRNRYMAFNAGRFEALAAWYGGPDGFDRWVATASGVGHDRPDLVVHCLTARTRGVAVDNPRQVAPYRYSPRYGPLPPCFSRATVMTTGAGERLLLVGGTASIVGEDSAHRSDLSAQLDETLANLSALIAAAEGGAPLEQNDALARFRELRVYHKHDDDRGALAARAAPAFPGAAGRIEYVRADLCRAELLVEIEGVAELSSPAASPAAR